MDLYLFYIYVYSKISVCGKVNILYRDQEVQNLVEFVSVEKNNEIKQNLYFPFLFSSFFLTWVKVQNFKYPELLKVKL